MKVGAIYYTDSGIEPKILNGCIKQIKRSFSGEVVAVSLKRPVDFKKNIILNRDRGIMTYFTQILTALENSTADYVFFLEHDILYHPSHFNFVPLGDDTFYYNTNVWKWNYYNHRVITYNHQASVSGMSANRELALRFYRRRLKIIYDKGYDKVKTFGNPTWARNMGYEPGKHGGRNKLEPAKFEEWWSTFPIIDIRHTRSMTVPKMRPEGFKKKPENWQETLIENLPGWHEPWKLVGADFSKPAEAHWLDTRV